MAADTAASYDDDKGVSKFIEAGGGEEDAVAGELLEDQLVIKVACLCAAGEGFGAQVFFVGGGNGAEGCELVEGEGCQYFGLISGVLVGRETGDGRWEVMRQG